MSGIGEACRRYDRDADSAKGAVLRVTGVTANLPVADIDAARSFYADFLGLNVEGFNLGWVARFRSPDGRACVQVVTRDATSPQDSVISVHVGTDVDEAYAEAQRRGYEIVHPLTEEPWGVRRFFVRDPDGNVINIVSHVDE
jgi:predicted enzyme related to lactoylglutathione lyase